MTTLERIIEALEQLGHDGATAAEVHELLGNPMGTISGQLSSGAQRGKLVRLVERRDGKSVYVLPKYANGREAYRVNGPGGAETQPVERERAIDRIKREAWTEGYRAGFRDGVNGA